MFNQLKSRTKKAINSVVRILCQQGGGGGGGGGKCINFAWGGGGLLRRENLQISDLQRLASLVVVKKSMRQTLVM